MTMANLLDRFGRRMEAKEEELWACVEQMVTTMNVLE